MDSKEKSDGPPDRDDAPASTENITIHVHPTTGGQFEVEISPDETAEELRRKISRRFQTPKERLKVLFKEQVLGAKPLKDYKISDGSNVTLLPSVESGFSSTVQGTQQSIIQAIESLSDSQIDDFLSGRLPLTLALRVGDHMMFVQLQLEQSQANCQNAEPRPSRSHSSAPFSPIGQSVSSSVSPRLLTDMPSTPPHATLLPKPPVDYSAKKSSSSRTVAAEPLTAGPAPKVPKLTAKTDVADRNDFLKSDRNVAGIVPRPGLFHHHSAPSSPEEVPYAIFDPRLEALPQVTHHYNQITSHINHHMQGGANHLHRLVTACSSLEQVVAIPPTGAEPLKVPPMPETGRKSSRKRPSSLITPNPSPSRSSSHRGPYPDSVGPALPTTAAIIRNALLHHPQLSGFPGLPPTSLLSSAFAEYQASSRASQGAATSQSSTTTPTTPPAEVRLKHPITSNMLQASGKNSTNSSGHSGRSERSHHHHHRRAPTSGRLTSGSLSHHASGISGARVARQMQRLRRLCGSHQQCVAYSNRELATEISSIVHMARHHSRAEGSSHRKTHKACRECHGRERAPGSSPSGPSGSSSSAAQAGQTTGACIDSFTTHGPGIFSGTFSGSLHPSIQDPDGKPKRDPKTILQILTDLLNATHQYQGQLGNVGLLPQLFKNHFKGEGTAEKSKESKAEAPAGEKAAEAASTSSTSQKAQNTEKIHPSKDNQASHPRPVLLHPYQYLLSPQFHSISQKNATTKAPAQYLSSVSTIPIGNIPVPYALRHVSSRSSKRISANQEGPKHHRHHHRCHHYKHHGLDKPICCSSSSCRRQAKHHLLTASHVKRENENNKTKNKMKELKKIMEQQRQRRKKRRDASKVCTIVDDAEVSKDATDTAGSHVNKNHDISTAQGEVKTSRKMEVQFEIKEVAHEPPETVTV